MWYTNAFYGKNWICPNTTSVDLANKETYFSLYVMSCTASELLDKNEDITPYSDQTCQDNDAILEAVPKFAVNTMILSDSFNPYTYHNNQTVQTTTKFEGAY